jgi:hypothetical protein
MERLINELVRHRVRQWRAAAAFERLPAAADPPGWNSTYWVKMLSPIADI